MKNKLFLMLTLILAVLIGCAEKDPHPMDMTQALQNASTAADHEALAQHYEEVAKEMQAKVEEHKKLLAQYEAKGYLYGRRAIDFRAHCYSLINAYEKTVEANLSMAEMHRQMAQ